LQDVVGRRDLNLADRIHPNKDGIEIIVGNILPSVEQLITKIK
jgi:lysophospholipase L1-like esterase